MSEDRFDQVQLIGDEIHFDGELVALLTDNASASHRGRFTDLVEYGEQAEDEGDCDCPPRLHKTDCGSHKAEDGAPPTGDEYDQALDDLARVAKEYAKGGLLRMGDLATMITQLKKEES